MSTQPSKEMHVYTLKLPLIPNNFLKHLQSYIQLNFTEVKNLVCTVLRQSFQRNQRELGTPDPVEIQCKLSALPI